MFRFLSKDKCKARKAEIEQGKSDCVSEDHGGRGHVGCSSLSKR